ncbi:TetR/AcrR family transcriptional regulator [Rhodococcus triatomae]|nr:TetR family transcriptional regulator [Rhodococcus triatomae BKS 15-14]
MADRSRQIRKRQATTTAIQEAALDLFAEKGYEKTTLKEIADRADIAPRTLTHHFPAKHDLLFAMDPWTLDSLEAKLAIRDELKSVFDVVRSWYLENMLLATGREGEETFWRRRCLRAHIIRNSHYLQGFATASFSEFEELIASSLALSYSMKKDALPSRLAAVAIMGGLREIHYYSAEAISLGTPIEPMINEVFDFAKAGLESLRSPGIGG